MAHAHFLWVVQTPKLTNHLYRAQWPLHKWTEQYKSATWVRIFTGTILVNQFHFRVTSHFPQKKKKNEQHQIAWHNGAPLVFWFFLLNKLAPGWVCLDFHPQFAHHPPRHHENSAILSGWKLQEHLALSPDDCETN